MEITKDMLENFRSGWASSDKSRQKEVMEGNARASLREDVISSLPPSFSIDLWEGGTIDQKESNRCWILASMNPLRQEAMKRLGIGENFLLSSNYISFYDQLERSALFLSRIAETCDKELDEIEDLLRLPVPDTGQWYRFSFLADKYGVVPLISMPDTACFTQPRSFSLILNEYLRKCAWQIREEKSRTEREEAITGMISDIYGYLCRFMGTPPETVSFSYIGSDGKERAVRGMSPKAFYRECCGAHPEDYVMLINHPSKDYPSDVAYTEREDLSRGYDTLLNVDMPVMKSLVLRQLEEGEQVVFGADVRKQNDSVSGAMDPCLYDYKGYLGIDLTMPKDMRIRYHSIQGTHIMSFDGAVRHDGRVYWKVLNSRGDTFGRNGHYIMSDSWFDEYVLSAVVRKDLLSDELLEAWEKPPVFMPRKARYI